MDDPLQRISEVVHPLLSGQSGYHRRYRYDRGPTARARGEIATIVGDHLVYRGVDSASITTNTRVGLPAGFGFPRQSWDTVITEDGLPVVLMNITLSLASAARNIQNRINDVVALATSIAGSFTSPALASYRPFVAVLFITELSDTVAVRQRRKQDVYLPGSSDAGKTTNLEAIDSTFRRLIDEGMLGAACLLLVDRYRPHLVEPIPEYSLDKFVYDLGGYVHRRTYGERSSHSRAVELGQLLAGAPDLDKVLAGVAGTATGLDAVTAAVVHERRQIVADLQRQALEPDANETAMHTAMAKRYWLFGGRYTGVVDRRRLTTLDEADIVLNCADGSIEIIELKSPRASLVRQHRNHLIVSNHVHEAVGQCLNYLRSLDELGPGIETTYRKELGLHLDLRRARATIIIGHPDQTDTARSTREQIDQTIRSYNAHLTRITVLTYADLLENAARSLEFEAQ